jgi:hypothetical protein
MPKDYDGIFRKKRLTKELNELYRLRADMERLSKRGSECDTENLKFVNKGILTALDEIKKIDSSLMTSTEVKSIS